MQRQTELASEQNPVNFVIVAAPRTGSNFLANLLSSHPDILCHSELFHKDEIWLQLGLKRTGFTLGSVAERDADPNAFLKRVWEQRLGHSIVGFKILAGQSARIRNRLLLDRSLRKIVLKRRNLVKTYVSLETARRTQAWGRLSRQQAARPVEPLVIDPDKLKAFARWLKRYYAGVEWRLRLSLQRYLVLSYEELIAPGAIGTVLSFLGATPADEKQLESRFQKQSRGTLRDRIENFDELHQALGRSPLAAQLLADD